MNKLKDLITDIVNTSEPDSVCFRDLPLIDQQRLVAAYIEMDPVEVPEVIARMPEKYQGLAFAEMVMGTADLNDFQTMFRNAAISFYADLIDGEIDDYIRDYDADNGIVRIWA